MKFHASTRDSVKRKLEETKEHMAPYMGDCESTAELRSMCQHCEHYCGENHDYTHCEDMQCFQFWLAYQYMDWSASYGGGTV